jgi:hypothetical protein
MSDNLVNKAGNENRDNKPGSDYSTPSRSQSQDGGFLISLASVGGLLMLCNAFDTDLKILGAFFTMPLVVVGSYDTYRYYTDKREQRNVQSL